MPFTDSYENFICEYADMFNIDYGDAKADVDLVLKLVAKKNNVPFARMVEKFQNLSPEHYESLLSTVMEKAKRNV